MSIIHDALKKVQANLSKHQTTPTPATEGAASIPPVDPAEQTEKLASAKKGWQPILIIIVAVLITGGALYYIWDNYELDLNKIPGLAAMRRNISNATHKAPEPKPLAQVTITASQVKGTGPQSTGKSPTGTMNASVGTPLAAAMNSNAPLASSVNATASAPSIQGIPAALAKLVAPKVDNGNTTTLNIQGVMNGAGSKVALINDKIYEEGDEISGIKILTITVDAITILKDGKEEKIVVRHYGK